MPGRWRLAQRLSRLRPSHPAVAVPLSLAVADPDAVYHAVAQKPVVKLGIDLADGTGSVTKVPPVQVVRDRPGDLKVGQREFFVQRGELTLQIAVGHDGPPMTLLCPVRYNTDAGNGGLLRPPRRRGSPRSSCPSPSTYSSAWAISGTRQRALCSRRPPSARPRLPPDQRECRKSVGSQRSRRGPQHPCLVNVGGRTLDIRKETKLR